MLLFKRKIKSDNIAATSMSDKVARKIAGFGIKAQLKFATVMNNLLNTMKIKKLKTILLVFCITCGGYSIYLVANAIIKPRSSQQDFKVDQVEVPKHYDRTGEEIVAPENSIDEETYEKIQGFKKYMDSLKINKSKLYDSILQARPGLMDSVQMLEEIYNSQQLK